MEHPFPAWWFLLSESTVSCCSLFRVVEFLIEQLWEKIWIEQLRSPGEIASWR
jgi:hypothetical protein